MIFSSGILFIEAKDKGEFKIKQSKYICLNVFLEKPG